MIVTKFNRGSRQRSPRERLRTAALVAQNMSQFRHSKDLIEQFERTCSGEVSVVSGGYRAKALGFSSRATCSRYQAVRNWINQVLSKAELAGVA